MYMNTQFHVAPSLMLNERTGEWKMRKQYKFHGSARKSCPIKTASIGRSPGRDDLNLI